MSVNAAEPASDAALVHVEISVNATWAQSAQKIVAATQAYFASGAIPYWSDKIYGRADFQAAALPSSSSASSTSASGPASAATLSEAGHVAAFLLANVLRICVSLPLERRSLCVWRHEARVAYHVYRLSDETAAEESADADGDEAGGDQTVASHQWVLPNAAFEGMWEALVLDAGVQDSLLDYTETALHFADLNVDEQIVSWNRLVLLHGPPGTGKTTLCKSLAQKLSIRLSHRYTASALIEINAHSLFSKWFSESGKLVMRLFERIRDMLEDDSCLVCVLIDEVESLTAARQAALQGSEPSDAIRVVNALLTQLDRLKAYRNVLVLTTSNITDAIDAAFIDRGMSAVPVPVFVLHTPDSIPSVSVVSRGLLMLFASLAFRSRYQTVHWLADRSGHL